MIETCTEVNFHDEHGRTIFKLRIHKDIWEIDNGDEFTASTNTSLEGLKVFSKELSGWLEDIEGFFT